MRKDEKYRYTEWLFAPDRKVCEAEDRLPIQVDLTNKGEIGEAYAKVRGVRTGFTL